MTIKRISILIILVFGSSWLGCSVSRHNLTNCMITASKSADQQELSTAFYLLSQVEWTQEIEADMIKRFKKTQNKTEKLLLAYALSKRTQERKYTNTFINLYPQGRDQSRLYKIKTKYISVGSPLLEFLCYLAYTNDAALEKLICGLEYADGANGETAVEHIQAIHKIKPDAVKAVLNKYGIDLKKVGLSE